MKKISELNHKWWWRFTKVAYVAAALFIVTIGCIVIIDDSDRYDIVKHKVVCSGNYSNYKEFYAESADIYISSYYSGKDVYSNLLDSDKIKIRFKCGVTEEEKNKLNETFLNYLRTEVSKDTPKDVVQNYSDSLRPYYIVTEHKMAGGLFLGIVYCVVLVLGVIILSFILIRAFYYIVLGSFRPEK